MRAASLAVALFILFFGSLSANQGGDITPPVLVVAAADRYQIDTSNRPQAITFSLHLTDDLSGVAAIHFELVHERGYNTSRGCHYQPDVLSRDSTLQCSITWPQYSAEGRWLVSWFWMQDGVGNSVNLPAADCSIYDSGMCKQFEYNERATEVIRSMEIVIGPSVPGTDPPLYLPWLAR